MVSSMLKPALPFQKLVFYDMDNNILWVFVHVLLIAHHVLNKKLHFAISYFCVICLYRQWCKIKILAKYIRERSGSVVECLTGDQRAAGSSLTGVTALWSLSKTHLS